MTNRVLPYLCTKSKQIIILIISIFLISCAPAPLTPNIDKAVLTYEMHKGKIYDICLLALHMEKFKFTLQRINKENGIINTQWRAKDFIDTEGYKGARGRYILQLVVCKLANRNVVVNATVEEPSWVADTYTNENVVSRDISLWIAADIKKLFERLNSLLNEAGYDDRNTNLIWTKGD